MKTNILHSLAAFGAFLMSATSSQADVLVYKGSVRIVSDATGVLPRTATIFEVIDLDASTIASVSALVVDGKKVQLVSPPNDFRITQVLLTNGKTASTISLALSSGGSNDFFSNTAFHFRGKNSTLETSTQLGSAPAIFPRTITSRATQDSASNGKGSFVEQIMVLGYQEARTKAANDVKQTTDQVISAISAELKTRGFNLP